MPPSPGELVERLLLHSEDCILEDRHIWLNNRDTTVRLGLDDLAGVAGFYFPPIAGKNATVTAMIDGQKVAAGTYEWRPTEFIRRQSTTRLRLESSLVAVPGGGWLMALTVENLTDADRALPIEWRFEPAFGLVDAGKWGWVPPESAQPTVPAHQEAVVCFKLADADCAVALATNFSAANENGERLKGVIELPGRTTATVYLALAAGPADSVAAKASMMAQNGERVANETRHDAAQTLEERFRAFPTFRSSHRGLDAFHDRGVFTFLTCLWESDGFRLHPHMAESGIDGGAVCNYFWGIAYIAKLLAISRPDLLRAHIVQALQSDPFEHYAYTPIDGTPVGPWYSYNQFSIVWCIAQYVDWTGDAEFLGENVGGKTVFEWARENALYLDNLEKPVQLIDYGDDHNLLELRRTDAYRHFVPSPNAERVWCYYAVDRLAAKVGLPDPGLSERGRTLARLIQDTLWREDLGWFGTLDADGRGRTAWSIQIFDMLRFGFLDDSKKDALLQHLNDDEFLSAHGVHSLSKRDPGYDETDVDWGGPGVYAGDGPELVEDLFIAGANEQGDEILRRILWWGSKLPYIPQALRADTIDYRRDGRANVVAALKTAEAVVFGLTGLTTSEGRIGFKPHLPPFVESFSAEHLTIRGHDYGIEVSQAGFRVVKDGAKVANADLGGDWVETE